MSALKLMVTYDVKPGCREKFLQDIIDAGIDKKIRNEKGCVYYNYYFAAQKPDELLLLEEWESAEDQKVHMTQPHMQQLFAIKDKYCNGTKLVKYELAD